MDISEFQLIIREQRLPQSVPQTSQNNDHRLPIGRHISPPMGRKPLRHHPKLPIFTLTKHKPYPPFLPLGPTLSSWEDTAFFVFWQVFLPSTPPNLLKHTKNLDNGVRGSASNLVYRTVRFSARLEGQWWEGVAPAALAPSWLVRPDDGD